MRTKNSLMNIGAGLANQIIITLLSFVSRTVFINTLGVEYLGINGLFTNILSMLTIAEAGLGASIMYSLYKPVAENDYHKISVLMKFYRNTYMIIALVILILGLSVMPFLDLFVQDTNVENLYFIYLIFLLNTVAPYFYIHKNSFLNVCQKGYIVTGIYSISSILSILIKIAILHYTHNYILYLMIESIITIINSIVLAMIVNKMYPYLKNKIKGKLDKETRKGITKNVKAIVIQNIGNYLIFGTDNIIISSFVSVAAVGLYSNYNMLIEICRTFTYQVFHNIYHSVGNLVAKESVEKIYSVYKTYQLVSFWLYSTFAILLLIVLEDFITLWIGSKYLMEEGLILILIIIFYERGMRNSISTIKTTAGIFHEDRFAPLCQAAINLIISILFVQRFGISGVFIGTLVSVLAVPFWTTPYLVYKKVFYHPVSKYFLKYTFFTFVGIGTYFITNFICNYIPVGDLLNLSLKALVCLIVPNIVYICIFYKTEEFRYLSNILRNIAGKLIGSLNAKRRIRNAG
ncbi:oligosaccharide flippase family protein [Metabacillus litoralis]|uniref:Oligosaccharide flippase family protein n=1 Tax=Metabacillus litoralis TaxID=152268 RepID=A0A5C6W7I1_9BACI|nr:oligosaccharide flippase family protein [Metabacillus litoralis]TXC92360.1 oligosaccharide flippase family protein [Metabacillus litoralis]